MRIVSLAALIAVGLIATTEAVTIEQHLAKKAKVHKKKQTKHRDDKKFTAPTGSVNKSPGADRYQQVSTEFDNDYTTEEKSNGYKVIDASDIYNQYEDKDIETQLDGKALTQEFGGKILQSELNDRKVGAGFKDRGDLADMLASIKGSSVFMNHTPKEQL